MNQEERQRVHRALCPQTASSSRVLIVAVGYRTVFVKVFSARHWWAKSRPLLDSVATLTNTPSALKLRGFLCRNAPAIITTWKGLFLPQLWVHGLNYQMGEISRNDRHPPPPTQSASQKFETPISFLHCAATTTKKPNSLQLQEAAHISFNLGGFIVSIWEILTWL